MISNEKLKNEKKYLENTKNIIKEKLNKIDVNLDTSKNETIAFKKYVYNECNAMATSNNLDRVFEYMELIDEGNQKVDLVNKIINQKQKLTNSLNSPFFGKIIFNHENIYIGINAIEKDFINYIYDWRSPIASMYYNYKLGKASFDTPLGKEEGEITEKIQFKIENGILKWCIENSETIDDDILGEILSKSSDKLTNIVNTIQKEQNEIIRNTNDKVLITEGVAGSGKTEIALHRIAYLLYNNRNLNSNNILIFSPNDIFTEYISGVLPELSEENVLSTTFELLGKKYIDINTESYSNFLDRVYNNKTKIDEFSDNYIKKLENFLETYINNIKFKTGLVINNKKITKEDLNNYLKKYAKLTILERINTITTDIIDYFNLKNKHQKAIKEKLISILTDTITPLEIYNKFLLKENKETIKNKVLYQHITPLLYTTFYINDYPYESNIKHVVIDETQDYSIHQLKLIKKIFSKATFTILGDINQNLNPYINYNSLEEYGNIFDNYKYIKLNKSYRNTKNITDYTSKLLNIEINSIREKGTNVIIKNTIDLNKELNNLSGKIGIITKDKKTTEKVYNILKNRTDISSPIIDSKNERIVVLPIYLAKGLEFNSVIVYNIKDNKKLLYVSATRAQNNLIVYEGE